MTSCMTVCLVDLGLISTSFRFNLATDMMSETSWQLATASAEASLSHRFCPWGGYLVKLDFRNILISGAPERSENATQLHSIRMVSHVSGRPSGDPKEPTDGSGRTSPQVDPVCLWRTAGCMPTMAPISMPTMAPLFSKRAEAR